MGARWVCAVGLGLPAAAAAVDTGAPVDARPVAGRVVLDGRLDEDDWVQAPPLDRFVEYWPGDRIAPPEHTSARFLYDDRFLYVGFRADLREVSRLRRPFVRRDRVGASHDYVQVYLDPVGAHRGSYLFRVNARGSRADGYQNEANQTETLDPDYDWEVRTSIDPGGWSAELRIPLTTLRIARSGPQQWSVIVTRGVPRDQNTQFASAPFPHDSSCFLCFASSLGFADLEPRTDDLLVTASVVVLGHPDHQHPVGAHASLDAKWLPWPGAAVDLTLAPDFSQVEADQAQLTSNTRFALSLPEKRPFFREGTDLVSLPIPALYTRAIAAPEAGLRFTDRSDGVDATAFVARDRGRGPIVEPGFLSSGAVRPDVDADVGFARARGAVGPVDLGGVAIGKRNLDGSVNAVGGPDLGWGDDTDRVTAELLGSYTAEPDRPDLLSTWDGERLVGVAALAEWDHTGAGLQSTARYTRYDRRFRSWLGAVPRVGYDELYGSLADPVDLGGPISRIAPYLTADRLVGATGEEGGEAFGAQLSGARNLSLDVALHPSARVLTETGDPRRTTFVDGSISANPVRWLPLVSVAGDGGEQVDFATGTRTTGGALDAIVRFRPLDRLELEQRYAATRLGGLDGTRLRESVVDATATVFVTARLYAMATWEDYRSDRRFPAAASTRSTLAGVQVSWEVAHDLLAYAGVRQDQERPGPDATEVYLKVSRTVGQSLR